MSLREVERSISSSGVRRIYYKDEQGRTVERIVHLSTDHDPIVRHNQDVASSHRKHDGKDMRKVASIPVDIYLKELMKHDVNDFAGHDAIECITRKILNDTENYGYLRCVPLTYNIKQH